MKIEEVKKVASNTILLADTIKAYLKKKGKYIHDSKIAAELGLTQNMLLTRHKYIKDEISILHIGKRRFFGLKEWEKKLSIDFILSKFDLKSMSAKGFISIWMEEHPDEVYTKKELNQIVLKYLNRKDSIASNEFEHIKIGHNSYYGCPKALAKIKKLKGRLDFNEDFKERNTRTTKKPPTENTTRANYSDTHR